MFEFIESCLRHKSEMVIYRVTHVVVVLKELTQCLSSSRVVCATRVRWSSIE